MFEERKTANCYLSCLNGLLAGSLLNTHNLPKTLKLNKWKWEAKTPWHFATKLNW